VFRNTLCYFKYRSKMDFLWHSQESSNYQKLLHFQASCRAAPINDSVCGCYLDTGFINILQLYLTEQGNTLPNGCNPRV